MLYEEEERRRIIENKVKVENGSVKVIEGVIEKEKERVIENEKEEKEVGEDEVVVKDNLYKIKRKKEIIDNLRMVRDEVDIKMIE